MSIRTTTKYDENKFKKELNKLLKKFGLSYLPNQTVVETQQNEAAVINTGVLIGDVRFPIEEIKSYYAMLEKECAGNIEVAKVLILETIKKFFEEQKKNLISMQQSNNSMLCDFIKRTQEAQKDLIMNLKSLSDEELEDKQNKIEEEIYGLKGICNEILNVTEQVKEKCKIIYEKTANTGKLVENLELLVKTCIQKADGTYQQSLSTMHLDMRKIDEMFIAIEFIKNKYETKCEGTEKLIETITKYQYNNESQYEKIVDKIKVIQDMLEELKNKKASNDEEIKSYDGKNEDKSYKSKKQELEKTNKEYESRIKELESILAELLPATDRAIFPCPYCGVNAERPVINGEAHCTVCGHRYGEKTVGIDLTVSSAEEVRSAFKESISLLSKIGTDGKGEGPTTWRALHSALLERVSGKEPYYRMKLDENHRPSSKGLLIIPNKTYDGKDVKEISFCEPNTTDKYGIARMKDVKTVILSNGVKLLDTDACYNGQQPFADKNVEKMEDLTNMMVKWVEDDEKKTDV